MQDRSTSLPLWERPLMQLLVMIVMAWGLVQCVYGCPVATMSLAVSALPHAQPALTIDSGMTLVWSMATLV